MDERINPVFITDNDTGVRYELDFNRDTVRWAEGRGFELENVRRFPNTGLGELFYMAFRMHHQKVAKDKTDKLLEKMGGVSESLMERLIQLYVQAQTSNLFQTDEELAKNDRVTLEL